jgi:hypothetical protein
VDRKLTHRDLRLLAFSCGVAPRISAVHGRGTWVPRAELGDAALPAAMKALLPLAFSARVV